MNQKSKSMLVGAVAVAALLVFVPSIYVTIANKLGRAAEIQKAS